MRKLVMVIAAVIMSFTLVGCGESVIEVSQYTLEYLDYDGTVLQTADYDFDADLSNVTAPTDPERPGYTFDSWSGTVPATMGEESVTLIAMYTVNQYMVEYVDYDGTVLETEDYNFGADLSGVIAPNAPVREGYTFNSWSGTVPATMGPTKVTITATYTVNQNIIEYVDYDGTVLQTEGYDFGADLSGVIAPTDPERLGYTFDSWSGTLPATMGEETITLTALYLMTRYTISYDLDGGKNAAGNESSYNIEDDTITLLVPRKTGSTFLGWYDTSDFSGNVVTEISSGSSENKTLYAKWEVNEYTVEYIDHDGTVFQTADYEYGVDLSGVTAPTKPTRLGYTFYRWGGTVPETMEATKVTITALYTINKYTIRYNLDGGINHVGNVTAYNIESRTITLEAAKKAGATFLGWYDNSSFRGFAVTTIPHGSYENITLYAKWDMDEYTVEYVDYDGTGLQITAYDTGADLSGVTAPADPVRDGYTFDSWSGTVPATMGTTKVTITATYTINQYTISYNLDGGINDLDNIATYNIEDSTFTLLEATKDEGTFVGWYDTSDFSGSVVTEISIGSYGDITLYAKWDMNEYIVEYIDFDGRVLQTNSYDYGTNLKSSTAPRNPTRAGYTFDGWSGTVPATMGTTKVTITATYTINQYTISYNLDGGINDLDNIATYNIEDSTFTLLEATKDEGTFSGWYDTSDFSGSVVTEISIGSYGDLTLYAKWDMNEYTVFNIRVDNSYDPTNPFNLAVGEIIISISTGEFHSAALTSEGRLFTWGRNAFGQLGDGTTIDKHVPTDITNKFNLATGETITSFSLGFHHSLALTSAGRIFTWGYNNYGDLGDGTIENKIYPTDITSQFNLNTGETILRTSLGGSISLAVTSEGRVFMWGYNYQGQIGDGTTVDKHIPTEITDQFNFAMGEIITSISLGYGHSSALTSEGRVFIWGYNYHGQLGDGTTVDKHVPTEITNQFNLAIGETITSISLGYSSSAAITSEGRLFTWGDNYFGQLGNGTTVDKHVPTEITNQFNLAIGETITTLSMSNHHSSTLTSEGRVFMWGYNSYGQLGDGTTVSKYIPTEITDQFNFAIGEIISSISLGSSHSLAITSEGRLFTWGDNYFGQLGNDDAPFKKNVPTEISYQFKFLSVYEEIIFDFDEELIDEFISYQGYTFDGWYTDSNLSHPYNGTRMPNYPLYALYIKD